MAAGSVVVWACVSYGDWGTTSSGGDGKLLIMAVLVAVAVPAGAAWQLIRTVPLLATARLGAPGEWMTPVAHVEAREQVTRHPCFVRRTAIHRHWWVALYADHGDTGDTLGLLGMAVEVNERQTRRAAESSRVAVYGRHRPGRGAVMAADNRVVWPKAQDSLLPPRETMRHLP